jgi:hypothetical protein
MLLFLFLSCCISSLGKGAYGRLVVVGGRQWWQPGREGEWTQWIIPKHIIYLIFPLLTSRHGSHVTAANPWNIDMIFMD